MRFLVQRVSKAEVRVENEVKGKINQGYMVLVGVHKNDTKAQADKLIKKLLKLRVFSDEEGKMNLDIKSICRRNINNFTIHIICEFRKRK